MKFALTLLMTSILSQTFAADLKLKCSLLVVRDNYLTVQVDKKKYDISFEDFADKSLYSLDSSSINKQNCNISHNSKDGFIITVEKHKGRLLFNKLSYKLLEEHENKCSKSSNIQEATDCLEDVVNLWDSELNRVYNSILSKNKNDKKKLIRAQQRSWLSYRDNYLNAYIEINDRAKRGAEYIINYTHKKIEIIQTQVFRLYSFINPN